ncbi:MAG: dihydroneopterin aldolase [Anaerolineaceae bacterium]|jgi:dihydroneopterin aldolase|nr:dihydroneopterin aldolase [Anaerolineaceae bacterium]MDD4042012.1 dihydroneopterin aldolase [Anaerolineaceae bacterium]MDD4577560.1 dihydroneopterin aldolase [Anaerolineaceae bacterium]
MDKILISGLVAVGTVGVKEPERDFPQELLLDIELEYPLAKVGKSDSIEDTISYSFVAKLLRKSVQESNFYTLEALAEHLANEIFEETPADAVRIKIEKANFVSKTSSVGVQIHRQRSI